MIPSDREMGMVFDHLCEMLVENPDPIVSSYLTEVDRERRDGLSADDFADDPSEKEAVWRKAATLAGFKNELRRLVAAVSIKKYINEETSLEAAIQGFEQGLDPARERKPWDAEYRVRVQDSGVQIFPRPTRHHHDFAHITNREYDVSDRDDIIGVVQLTTSSGSSSAAGRTMSAEVFLRSAYYVSLDGVPDSIQDELVSISPEDAVEGIPEILRNNRDQIVEDGIFAGATIQGFTHRSDFVHILQTDIEKDGLPDNLWITELEELSDPDLFLSDNTK